MYFSKGAPIKNVPEKWWSKPGDLVLTLDPVKVCVRSLVSIKRLYLIADRRIFFGKIVKGP